MCIAPYLPREGTETHIGLYLILKYSLYRSLSTSRGAGNSVGTGSVNWNRIMYSSLSTSRGAGNCPPREDCCSSFFVYQLREGSETSSSVTLLSVTVRYSYLSTSRGAENILIAPQKSFMVFLYSSLSASGGAENKYRFFFSTS